MDVTALDASPGAVDVCRRRGLQDVRLGDLRDPPDDKQRRGILMLCGNLGLAGDWDETRKLLSSLAEISAADAILIGDTVDPTTTDPAEIANQRRQQELGH